MSMHEQTIEISNGEGRTALRKKLVNIFLQEKAGTGTEEKTSRYKYYVETLATGNRIYLQSPANFNKGVDFLICVENFNYALGKGRKRNYPKHDDILNDLRKKKEENIEMYRKLLDLMNQVFTCHEIAESQWKDIQFYSGLSAEHILKVLKWMFIEQDITYWNYSGRQKLWNYIQEI